MRLSLRDILLLCLCHNSPLQMMLSLLNHVINDAVTDELAAETDQWSTQSEHSTCSARPHTQRCDVGRYGVASKAATDQIQQTNVRSLAALLRRLIPQIQSATYGSGQCVTRLHRLPSSPVLQLSGILVTIGHPSVRLSVQ